MQIHRYYHKYRCGYCISWLLFVLYVLVLEFGGSHRHRRTESITILLQISYANCEHHAQVFLFKQVQQSRETHPSLPACL